MTFYFSINTVHDSGACGDIYFQKLSLSLFVLVLDVATCLLVALTGVKCVWVNTEIFHDCKSLNVQRVTERKFNINVKFRRGWRHGKPISWHTYPDDHSDVMFCMKRISLKLTEAAVSEMAFQASQEDMNQVYVSSKGKYYHQSCSSYVLPR